jgi:hypothetical protein
MIAYHKNWTCHVRTMYPSNSTICFWVIIFNNLYFLCWTFQYSSNFYHMNWITKFICDNCFKYHGFFLSQKPIIRQNIRSHYITYVCYMIFFLFLICWSNAYLIMACQTIKDKKKLKFDSTYVRHCFLSFCLYEWQSIMEKWRCN